MTVSRAQITDLAQLAEEYHRTFSAGNLDAWLRLLDPDVEIEVDSFTMRGTDAARAYAENIEKTYPGVLSKLERVVATGEDTLVTESRLVNPNADDEDAWLLDGRVCIVFDFRDGLITRLRNYYLASPNDRTEVAEVPSRAEAAQIAEEQAALRRVATLVAQGVRQTELFVSVCREAAHLLGADSVNLGRFNGDATATNVGGWNADGSRAPIGLQASLTGESVVARVHRTSAPERIDDYDVAGGEIASVLRNLGIRSSVGVPVVVVGRPWGVLVASVSGSQPLAHDTESRMMAFSELVATAIVNAEARTHAARLAEEQAALRRVAMLVAREPQPAEVFAAVARELGVLLGADDAVVFRGEGDDLVSVAASWGEVADALPANRMVRLEGENVVRTVLETGRPARIDDYASARGPLATMGRDLGLGSGAGAPIVVHGRLWGVLSVSTRLPRKLPPDTEERAAQFADLVATAIANVDARSELAASRARLVAAADSERRRVVRDLHDGAQQALVHTIVTLKMAQRATEGGTSDAGDLVGEALAQAERATCDLRELSQGILPAVLTRDGLEAGVQMLATRSSVPLQIHSTVGRLPGAVEATAYFIVAEALTNIAKHAQATQVQVSLAVEDANLRVVVRDDGVGGAAAQGTGLVGLRDRLAALGGQLSVDSPRGAGTTLTALIPM